jgi:aminopeptidase N
LVRDLYQEFKYRNILTEDIVRFVNARLGANLTPVFDQYLRHAALPALELRFEERDRTVSYRWRAAEPQFAMPVRVGLRDEWNVIHPTRVWKTMRTEIPEERFEVATDLYYVDVIR